MESRAGGSCWHGGRNCVLSTGHRPQADADGGLHVPQSGKCFCDDLAHGKPNLWPIPCALSLENMHAQHGMYFALHFLPTVSWLNVSSVQ